MQGSIRWVVIAGLLSACQPGDIGPQDDDAAVGDSGLRVEWSSSPDMWPSMTNGIELKTARFALDSLRVIGDAGPGDPRTSTTGIDLRWDKDVAPGEIDFNDAPTGLYSQVALNLDGHTTTESFRIEGKVDVGSNNYDFRVEADTPLAFNIGIDEMVSPGMTETIQLRINFTHALDSVDWANVDTSDNRKEIDDSDPQMAMFRLKLVESFEIVNAGKPGGTP
jgi:hypothetical protein